MRAVFLNGVILKEQEEFSIDAEKHHHLKNVLRVKLNEEVLIIQGNGMSSVAKIIEINKKNTKLKTIKVNKTQERNKFLINLFVGLVKKDALESSIRSAVELGVSRIIFLKTENSQRYEFNTKRVQVIIENSLEQSNLLFLPDIDLKNIEEIDLKSLNNILLASNRYDPTGVDISSCDEVNLFIGPEAGFSLKEEEDLIQSGANTISLDTGILRTRTAIPSLVGYIYAKREKIDA